jgi:DNA-binding MarR family transcriptional regulator
LTGVLQRLTAQRLIVRDADPRDRRRAVLRLTRRGVRINAARGGTPEAAVAAALAQISQRDQEATARALERIAASLVAEPGSARMIGSEG